MVRGGHELNEVSLALTREFFGAVAENDECALWGEDDTLRIRSRERIDIEFRNPLYNRRLAEMWMRE